MSNIVIFCIVMAFVLGYLIGGNHGVRVSENLRRDR
jgi:hypothetical protein